MILHRPHNREDVYMCPARMVYISGLNTVDQLILYIFLYDAEINRLPLRYS